MASPTSLCTQARVTSSTHSTSIQMHPAANKIFGTTELFEMILLNASPKDLLLWQRVNKHWQTAIHTSPLIQTKLFFRVDRLGDRDCRSAALNPFQSLFFKYRAPETSKIADDAFDGKASYPKASWRQMFLTSPAIEKLRIIWTEEDPRDPFLSLVKYTIFLENGDGIKLRDLAKAQRECPNYRDLFVSSLSLNFDGELATLEMDWDGYS